MTASESGRRELCIRSYAYLLPATLNWNRGNYVQFGW